MQNISKKNIGGILIVCAALLWALDGIIRRSLYSLPPISIIFYEHLFGLIILFPFVVKFLPHHKLAKKDVWLLILVAFLSGLLGTLWFTIALGKVHFISFSVVFLLQKLQPIFAILTASIFLKEKVNKKYVPYIVIALISAYFVTFKNGYVSFATGEGTIVAALYALGAAFAWGSSTTFSKMLLNKFSAQVSTFYRFLFTTVMALLAIFLFGYTPSLSLPTFSQFSAFAFIAVSTGMVGLLIYYKGLKTTKVHVATILELAFPFLAVFIDIFMYHTTLAVSQYIAGIVLIYAMYKLISFQRNADTN